MAAQQRKQQGEAREPETTPVRHNVLLMVCSNGEESVRLIAGAALTQCWCRAAPGQPAGDSVPCKFTTTRCVMLRWCTVQQQRVTRANHDNVGTVRGHLRPYSPLDSAQAAWIARYCHKPSSATAARLQTLLRIQTIAATKGAAAVRSTPKTQKPKSWTENTNHVLSLDNTNK